jgi:hypothetical protein
MTENIIMAKTASTTAKIVTASPEGASALSLAIWERDSIHTDGIMINAVTANRAKPKGQR